MQGISVYKRADRPTWYVAYDCPKRFRRVNESTGFLIDDPQGKLKAYSFARERGMSGIAHGRADQKDRWEGWTAQWLKDRFRNHPKTLTSYLGAWKFILFFLNENSVFSPRLLTRQHVVDFVHWRETQKKRSGKTPGRNTAIHNVQVLSRVMREAIARSFATVNPCLRMGDSVTRDPVAQKPEFSDAQVEKIRAEFARRHGIGRPSDWMPIAFEIALHQICRLSATQIPMSRIDLERNTVTLVEKGSDGKPTVFTLPIHPHLRPLLVKLHDAGREFTCVIPRFASRNFTRFLRSIGLPVGYSFHCTRVTGITRMARAGVPIQQALRFVHHGDIAVNQIYQRLGVDDLSACLAALNFSGVKAPAPGRPQSPDAVRATERPSRGSSTSRKKSVSRVLQQPEVYSPS